MNFNLSESSPCINSGDPNQFDPDGSIRDIGSLVYNFSILGDCSGDSVLNVLDIIFIINNCIFDFDNTCNGCSDIDGNNIVNILDVVSLVNEILQGN